MSIRNFALLGHPIGHTMSPFIHDKLFALSGHSGTYRVLDTPPTRMARVVKNVLNTFQGYNVTIPHKQRIIPFLDTMDEKAARYGSVNTVHIKDRHAKGYTTDPDGLLEALRGADMPLAGRVVVLGSGGVARVMAYEAALAGCEINIAARDEGLERAEALAAEIVASCAGSRVSACTLSAIDGTIDLMMNATPVGMYPNTDAMPVAPETLSRVKNLFDAIYNPGETKLMRAARAGGAQVLGGMSMLVWQAAAAHSIWDGAVFAPADIDALCEEATAEMARRFAEA